MVAAHVLLDEQEYASLLLRSQHATDRCLILTDVAVLKLMLTCWHATAP